MSRHPLFPHAFLHPFDNAPRTPAERRQGRIGLALYEARNLMRHARDWKAEGRPDMASKLARSARRMVRDARGAK